MSIALESAPCAWNAVLETAGQFRDECLDLEQQVEHLLGELERTGFQLAENVQALARERAQLNARDRELAEERKFNERLTRQNERHEARLAEALEELKQLRAQSANADQSSVAAAMINEWQARERQAVGERDQLRLQVESTHEEIIRLGNALQNLALAHAANESRELPSADTSQDELVAQLEQERSMLEAELELVRRRAAELAETAVQQKRELAESRAETTGELRLVRSLLEQQARLLSERAAAPQVHGTLSRDTAAPESASSAEAAHDPVIDSVMAQFAKLQKDVNSRRLKKK